MVLQDQVRLIASTQTLAVSTTLPEVFLFAIGVKGAALYCFGEGFFVNLGLSQLRAEKAIVHDREGGADFLKIPTTLLTAPKQL